MMRKRNVTVLLLSSLVSSFFFLACKRGYEGVPECDDYFKAIDSCGNDGEKETLKSASNLEKEGWKYLGSDAVKDQCVERAKYVKERCDVGPEGVKACEDYFKLVEGCKEGPGKATQQNNAKERRNDWKSMPKKQLESTCKQNLEMAEKFCK
jgi:hypothetical protein